MWLPIPQFPHYEVSDDGQVRSWRKKKRAWRDPDLSGIRDEPILMSPATDARGYKRVPLRDASGKAHQRLVHRLVAQAFIANPRLLPDVAHNDGNPSNNHASNLRWSTHRDNQMDMRRHGTMQDGEKCRSAKLTQEQVLEIRERLRTGKRGIGRQLAAEFGVSTAQISRIGNGARWYILIR